MQLRRYVGRFALVVVTALLGLSARPAFAQADLVINTRQPAVCNAQSATPYLVYSTSDGHWHCSATPAQRVLNVGGDTVAGDALVATSVTKAVTGLADATATDVFTVTVPNAQHAAVIDVDVVGVLGAGGAVGAGEGSRIAKYQVILARTPGANAVATASAAIGGAEAHVSGAASVSTVVVTLSAIGGATTAANTFTIKVAVTKSAGSSTNHSVLASARVLNQNVTGVTIQ